MTLGLLRHVNHSNPPPCSGEVSRNTLLATLPPAMQQLVRPYCARLPLIPGRLVFTADGQLQPLYFPESGAIGLVNTLDTGHSVQVGLIDRFGVAGLPDVDPARRLTCDGVVEIAGSAVRLQAEGFRIAMRDERFRDAFNRYLIGAVIDGARLTACNAIHTVEQRTARWLLMLGDIGGDEMPLTHDALSTMLGVRRPSITLGAQTLQQCGAIRYRHGRVTIIDRRELERRTCSCYHLMRRIYG